MNLLRPLFVYGTLKSGFGNHKRYLGDSACLGQAVTLDRFDMLDVGFPVLLPQQNEKAYRVLGEVYEVDEPRATRIDQLEGNGRMYQRQARAVQLIDSGRVLLVEMYIGLIGRWSDAVEVEPGPMPFDESEEGFVWHQSRGLRLRNLLTR